MSNVILADAVTRTQHKLKLKIGSMVMLDGGKVTLSGSVTDASGNTALVSLDLDQESWERVANNVAFWNTKQDPAAVAAGKART